MIKSWIFVIEERRLDLIFTAKLFNYERMGA